ncbi:MAG: hypothetical protein AAF465_14645 [Pseudomonadota bacterium]
MDNDLTATVRLVRRPKVVTDEVGGTVWTDPVGSIEVELVSTMMLKVMLADDEGTVRQQLLDLERSTDGILAHNAKDKKFEVVKGDALKAALGDSATSQTPETEYVVEQVANDLDELSLVSTQMIQIMLEKPELSPQEVYDELEILESPKAIRGFNPYDSS